jgi:hypothetical protein
MLYKYGGIYIDMKYVLNGFSLNVLIEKEHFLKETNGILSCKAGNEVMRSCIYKIVENCKNRLYGDTPDSVRGNHILKTCIPPEYSSDLSVQNGDILYNSNPILTAYPDYSLDRELFGTPEHRQLWNEKSIYTLKKESPHIYFIVTTSLFDDCPIRKEQYTNGIIRLKNTVAASKIQKYTILIVENNGKRKTFLDDLGCKVYYTENNTLQEFDKGYRELKDIFDCISEFSIKDSDFIVKMTGRYSIYENSEFIHTLEELDKNEYDCIIKFGSYMKLGLHDKLDDINMGDCITGLIGMTCKYVKQIEYPIDYIIVEWEWAKVAKSLHPHKVCKLKRLGISICPGGNIYFPV